MNLGLTIGLLLVPTLGIAAPAGQVPTATPDQARALFPHVSHDFGPVPRGLRCPYTFAIHNRRDVAVRIAKVQATCGCVALTATEKDIEPGERSHLLATLDTSGASGTKQEEIFVLLDRPQAQHIVLRLQATVRPELRVSPGEIDLGRPRYGAEATHTLHVDYTGSLDFRIEAVAASLSCVSARAEPVSRQPGSVRYQIVTRLSGKAPLGLVQDQVRCTTNHPRLSSFTVALRAHVVKAFQVDPATLFFGFVAQGATLRRSVQVHGDRPFRITRAHSAAGLVRVPLPTQAQREHTLTVVLQPGDRTGNLRDEVALDTDLPNHPTLKFTVYVHVRKR